MKKNILSVVAIIISVIALLTNFLTLNKVNKLQEQLAYPNNIQETEDYSEDQSTASHSFDQTLVGDWSGTIAESTLYARMKVLEDSSIIIESLEGQKFIYM